MTHSNTYNFLAMKTKYLLPHSWRPFGWSLLLICLPLSLWFLFGGEDDFLHTKIAPLFEVTFKEGAAMPFLIDDRAAWDQGWTHGFLDEIITIGVIAGLFIVGFARLKVEDEYIVLIRLEALQWGIYANYLVLVGCVLFVYEIRFLMVMEYNIFTPLLIFVFRFYWLLWIKRGTEVADI